MPSRWASRLGTAPVVRAERTDRAQTRLHPEVLNASEGVREAGMSSEMGWPGVAHKTHHQILQIFSKQRPHGVCLAVARPN